MQRTLFYIPHSIFGLPLVGLGWALILLAVAFVVWLLVVARNPRLKWQAELKHNGFVWLVAAVVITFVLPAVEIRSINGDPIGIAVRGYGVLLLAGVVSGISLALLRAPKLGIERDHIFALALWMFVGGIGGARLFYIVEYRDSFMTGSLGESLRKMLDFTRGGLVVYGSIIGGTLAIIAYSMRRRVSALRLCDVIIPSLFIGLFFGRLGCLMNGCCYGGRCEPAPYALQFPPGSPVYVEQLESGELLGLEFETEPSTEDGTNASASVWPRRVASVSDDSPAAKAGIRPGDTIERIAVVPPLGPLPTDTPADDTRHMAVSAVINGRPILWQPADLPQQAMPVYPAQIISSLSGLGICILLLTIARFTNLRVGALTAIGFASYALVRFGEEIVRSDEPGQFGTGLSISQWVSLLVFPAAVGLIFYIYVVRPTPRVRTLPSESGTGPGN